MFLQSSYIFLKNPFKEADRTKVVCSGVYAYVYKAFQNMKNLSTNKNFLHRESECVCLY